LAGVEKWQTIHAVGTVTTDGQKNRDFENTVIFQATRLSLKKWGPAAFRPHLTMGLAFYCPIFGFSV
jgi:hypothetical protein